MPVEEHELEENKQLIEDLRKRLLSRGPELCDFDEKDLDRVQQNDFYVWSFLKTKNHDVDKAQVGHRNKVSRMPIHAFNIRSASLFKEV